MIGGVSHLESFDPKPALNKYAGKSIAETPLKGVLDKKFLDENVRTLAPDLRKILSKLYPLQVGYRKRGESGIEVSDWWPHVGGCVDDLAVIRSMWTNDIDHGAQLQFHTGRNRLDGFFPTIGSWVHYGLGTLNENLPQFVVMGNPVGRLLRRPGSPPRQLPGPRARRRAARGRPGQSARVRPPGRRRLSRRAARPSSRCSSGSTASRWPSIRTTPRRWRASSRTSWRSACSGRSPKCSSFSRKPPTRTSCTAWTTTRPRRSPSIASRRGGWSSAACASCRSSTAATATPAAGTPTAICSKTTPPIALRSIKPIAALIRDLKQRGMLDETLVVWATEFGRSPGTEGADGRDHHPFGFSVWMAGGGIKGGVVHGATDELGFSAVENRHYVTDIHATVLHQLGLDSRRLEIPGRKRLEMEHGHVIRDIIA